MDDVNPREVFSKNAQAYEAARLARRSPAEKAADPTPAERKLLDDADKALKEAVAAREAIFRADIAGRSAPTYAHAPAAFLYEPSDELRKAEMTEQSARVARNKVHREIAQAGSARQMAAEAEQ